jgi:hypothetical protein
MTNLSPDAGPGHRPAGVPASDPGPARPLGGEPAPVDASPTHTAGGYALAALLFAAGWMVFAWSWLMGRVVVPWDGAAYFLPQVQFLAASLADGHWPGWLPFVFSGYPQIADPQAQAFSPPMIGLALLWQWVGNGAMPGSHAVSATVLCCLLAAGLGVILLFRGRGWHPAGALVGAFGFALGAAMAWRLQHFEPVISLAYLPFALWLLDRALTRRSIAWGTLAGTVIALIIVGRNQVALLSLYLLAGFAAAHVLTTIDKRKALQQAARPLAAAGVTAGLLALVPVVLTALLAADSNRPMIDFAGAGRGSLHPALLLTAITPHLYGAAGAMADYWGPPSFTWAGTDLYLAQNMGVVYIGALPLALLLGGLARGVLWARDVRVFTIALTLCLLYALGRYTPAFRAFYEVLPGVSFFRRPADAVFLIGGLASIIAGYALHRLLGDQPPNLATWRRLLPLAAIAALFIAALLVAHGWDRAEIAAWPLFAAVGWFAAALAILWFVRRLNHAQPWAAMVLIGTLGGADLAVNNGPNGASGLPPGLVAMLEPATANPTVAALRDLTRAGQSATRRDRVELVGLGFHWPNASITHRLENTLGYNPVRLGAYALATGAEDHAGLPDQRVFSPLFPSYQSRLADLLGLRYIASGVPVEEIDKRLGAGGLNLIGRTADAFIYENPRALPRVLFATRAVAGDFEQMMADGDWPRVEPDHEIVLETVTPAERNRPPRRPGRVAIQRYADNEVVVDATSEDGGWVVLNDIWHPWWFAEVNGEPAPVVRANVLFRAVRVAAGRQQVRFTFRPLAGAWRQILGAPPD